MEENLDIFDFALTDRPIVLYQPDQTAYLDDRGACFDIREFAPGPIARQVSSTHTAAVRSSSPL